MPDITIKNLNFNYCEKQILQNINLNVNNGDFIAVLGESGSGKSTFLKILASILTKYSGSIKFNGSELKSHKQIVSYMPQNNLLLPWRTALDNTIVPLQTQGKSKKLAREIALKHAEEFNLLDCINRYPGELSGGQKQRVTLLRSLLVASKLMLLDEPFSKLDALNKSNFHKMLLRMHAKYSYTSILVTHDIDEALLLADTIHIFSKNGALKQTLYAPRVDINERSALILLQDKFITLKRIILNCLND